MRCALIAIASMLLGIGFCEKNLLAQLITKYEEVPLSIFFERSEQLANVELIDSQKEELRRLQQIAHEKYRAILATAREKRALDGDADQYKKTKSEAAADYRKQVNQAFEKVLLPHQTKRLTQLFIWQNINQSVGFGKVLGSPLVSKELSIDDSQKKKIESRAEELQKKFEADFLKLRSKYRNELAQSLNPDQRKKLKELLGDESKVSMPKIRF